MLTPPWIPVPTPTPAVLTEEITVSLEDLIVTEEIQGSCWTESHEAARPDAYRCMSDGTIYDPCFSSDTGAFVVCPTAFPPDMTSIRINLTEPLPELPPLPEPPLEPPPPWAVQFADGTRCRFVSGATFALGGGRANYSCEDDSWVMGFPWEHFRNGAWVAERFWFPESLCFDYLPGPTCRCEYGFHYVQRMWR